jgi:hypothetical protein
MIFIWIASSFSISLLGYNAKNISGNFFLNFMTASVFDIPIAMIGGYLYHKFGLKPIFFTFFLVSFIGHITIVISSETNPGLVPIMLTFAKGGVKVTYDLCFLGNSFLFPSIFAGTTFGFCNAGAKLASIMAPLLAEVDAPIPFSVNSALVLFAAIISLFLKASPSS